jgi:hypothetical protein
MLTPFAAVRIFLGLPRRSKPLVRSHTLKNDLFNSTQYFFIAILNTNKKTNFPSAETLYKLNSITIQ